MMRSIKIVCASILAVTALIIGNTSVKASPDGEVSSTKTAIPVNIYVVKKGDNLWAIAQRNHCSLMDLIKANLNVTQRPDKTIYAGEEINVPNKDTMDGLEAQVLTLTNKERSKSGLPALKGDNTQLNRAARIKSEDQANRGQMGHNSPTLGSPFDQMRNMGITYRTAGENVAMGQPSAAEVVKAWMNSPGHKANIMNRNYTHLGVGYAIKNGKPFWTQMFIGQ